MRTKTTITFIANDGTEFATETECRDHERSLMSENQSAFDRHFSVVKGISGDIQEYVIGISGYHTYSFIAFEGWEQVLRGVNDSPCFEVNTSFWCIDPIKEGERYLVFFTEDEAWVVDPKNLKEQIMRDLAAMGI